MATSSIARFRLRGLSHRCVRATGSFTLRSKEATRAQYAKSAHPCILDQLFSALTVWPRQLLADRVSIGLLDDDSEDHRIARRHHLAVRHEHVL